MTLMDIAAGVLIGNLLSAWFIWGAYHAAKRSDDMIPWIAYSAMLVPLGIAGLSLIAAGALPG